jgi:hypothetical protein
LRWHFPLYLAVATTSVNRIQETADGQGWAGIDKNYREGGGEWKTVKFNMHRICGDTITRVEA